MRTAVIRIREREEGPPAGYPVELLLDDGQSPDWRGTPAAKGHLPADLALPGAPGGAGTELTEAQYRELLLGPDEPSDDLKTAGEHLFGLLSAAVGAAGVKAWRQARPASTVLEIAPLSLRLLPWELLRNDLDALFLDANVPVSRQTVLPGAPDVPMAPLTWPLRVLVVLAWNPRDEKIKGGLEVEAIQDATCRLRHWYDVELLRQPTKEALKERYDLFQPHILHFIGHGGSSPQGGLLEVWNDAGAQDWMADEVYGFLRAAPPRLAFLNACRSASMGAAGAAAGSWDVASALLKAGTAAVLGMQGDIQGDAAAKFSRAFYAELVKGTPLDRAVALGRMQLMAATSARHRDWALPRLELAVAPEQVFPMESPAGKALELLDDDAFREITTFVDRSRERRQIREGLERRNGQAARDVLVISGEQQIGKTWILKCCLQGCAARGHRVVYVDLKRKAAPPYTVVDVLRQIRGPLEPSPEILRPHLYPHFWRFNEELNHLLRGKEPPEPAAVQPEVVDELEPFEANRAHPDLLRRIFQSFLPALRDAAGGLPLVVALDHLADTEGGVLRSDLQSYLLPSLVLPVAQHLYEPVRLILALRDADFGVVLPKALVQTLTLKEIPSGDFEALAREYLYLSELDRDAASDFIAATKKRLEREHRTSWAPYMLSALVELIRTLIPGRL